jgi:hypothetical protein
MGPECVQRRRAHGPWADAPPAGDQAGEDRAGVLIRSGLGRRRLARELGIREHEARQLIEQHRAGVAA